MSDSSPVVSRSLNGAGVNWGRLMKQGMMGRREGKRVSLLFAFPSPPAPASLIKIINENIRDDWGRVSIRMGTNMAARNKEKHLSLRFATKA